MKLSRDLSNLVVFTNSVASQECLNEGETRLTPTQTQAINCNVFQLPVDIFSLTCSVVVVF